MDYSVVSVREESGSDFTRITSDNDRVCMPMVRRSRNGVNWLTNRIIDISKDGNSIAFLSERNNTTNIFVKDIFRQGASVQRTNRAAVLDFSYSPDGTLLCFSEGNGKGHNLLQTDATSGFVCRQITSGADDYSPVYSEDQSKIFFSRAESNGVSIWSFDTKNNFLSSYTSGQNPCLAGGESILCTRINGGRGEIWRIDYNTGVEECIVSSTEHSFSSPVLSPDGQWLLFTGSTMLTYGKISYWNTDIYAARTDGTSFTQLTYHAADDLSPIWSDDGRYIFFISQRGSADAVANIWRMTFPF